MRCSLGIRRIIARGAATLVLSFLAHAAVMPSAYAQNLAVDGNFSVTTGGTAAASAEFGSTNNGFTPTQQLLGWATAGYNFVFLPNAADTTGSTGQYTVKLWGPANGGTNAASLPLSSPTGGDYIGADGAFEVSAITQTVNGLIPGQNVTVSFAWAGAQQSGFTGPTSDKWTVSLGTVSVTNPSQSTNVVSLLSEGATPWMNQTFTFVATSTSELLSFLTTGTPAGQPPFALLANVSVSNVPEPAGVGMFLTGLGGLLLIAKARRTVAAPNDGAVTRMSGFLGLCGAIQRAGRKLACKRSAPYFRSATKRGKHAHLLAGLSMRPLDIPPDMSAC